MLEQELKIGNEYIIKGRRVGFIKDVYKIEIIELTNHSIYYLNKDLNNKKRETLIDFELDYLIVEDLGNIEEKIQKELVDIHNIPYPNDIKL